jgi:NTE family protein
MTAESRANKNGGGIFAASERENEKRPKIGLALGGGSVRGGAHVGVLKVFSKYGIKVNMIAGTSVGSFVGALFACGYGWQEMEALMKSLNMESLFRVRPNRMGLIPATPYLELAALCTKNANIEDTLIPLRIVAVDVIKWRKIVFSEGNIAHAIRASSAVPGIFTPVKKGDMLLADGFLLDNVPGGVVRDMGADIVIAVDLSAPVYDEPRNIGEMIYRSIEIMAWGNQSIDADFIIKPIVKPIKITDMKMLIPAMEMGERVAEAAAPEILRLIHEKTLSDTP